MHRQFEFFVVKAIVWPRRLLFVLPRLSVHHENSSSLGTLGQRAQTLSLLPIGATQAASWRENACGLEKQPVLLASRCQEHAHHRPYFYSQAERTELEEAAQAFHAFMTLHTLLPCPWNAIPLPYHSSLLGNFYSSFNTSNRNSFIPCTIIACHSCIWG